MAGRIRWRQMTPRRALAAVARRVRDWPHRRAWESGADAERNRERLGRYAERHAGQRCFVLCNGPSLAKMDLSPLAGEVSFGTNRIYLLGERLPFAPTYFAAVNHHVLAQFADEIAGLPMPRFLCWQHRRRFADAPGETLFVRNALTLRDFFGTDPRRPLCSGGTVTYTALQLAWFMGFRQVVLVGADHDYAVLGTPNRTERRGPGADHSHFHPRYFPPGTRWQLPDLERSERAYALARDTFRRDGREILDATVGGRLSVFEKVRFESLFES